MKFTIDANITTQDELRNFAHRSGKHPSHICNILKRRYNKLSALKASAERVVNQREMYMDDEQHAINEAYTLITWQYDAAYLAMQIAKQVWPEHFPEQPARPLSLAQAERRIKRFTQQR